MVVKGNLTVHDEEQQLGGQLRRARIAQGFDQATLAKKADVSLAAMANLENGRGSSLKTLIKVVRALGRTDWFERLAPEITVSPMAALRQARRGDPLTVRQRVRRTETKRNLTVPKDDPRLSALSGTKTIN